MVFLATTTPGDSAGTMKPLGSFVYAMPDVGLFFVSDLDFLSIFIFLWSYSCIVVQVFILDFPLFWIGFALPGLFAFMALHIIS